MSRPATDTARQRRILRQTWVRVHRWLGLAMMVVFLLIGASGTVLALKGPILRWEMGPSPWQAPAPSTTSLSEQEVKMSALKVFPRLKAVMGVAPPHAGFFDSPNMTVFGSVVGKDRAMGVGFIDPTTGAARGFAIYDDLMIAKVVALHRSLLLPLPIGGPLLALSGLFLLISTGSGLWLWWPRTGNWSASLFPRSLRRGRIGLMAFHRWAGAWLAFPMLVLATSGIWLAMPRLWAHLLGLRAQPGQGTVSLISLVHANLLAGSPGALIVGLSGVILSVLAITGLWSWWRSVLR